MKEKKRRKVKNFTLFNENKEENRIKRENPGTAGF